MRYPLVAHFICSSRNRILMANLYASTCTCLRRMAHGINFYFGPFMSSMNWKGDGDPSTSHCHPRRLDAIQPVLPKQRELAQPHPLSPTSISIQCHPHGLSRGAIRVFDSCSRSLHRVCAENLPGATRVPDSRPRPIHRESADRSAGMCSAAQLMFSSESLPFVGTPVTSSQPIIP